MKEFFTEWWNIKRTERAMEKAYFKTHWKGVVILNAAIIVAPFVVNAIDTKVKEYKHKKETEEE